jgi:LysM repeat protein
MEQRCGPIRYEVRKNDTLESIAAQFSTSVEEIIQANHLRTATLNTSMKLSIHDCSSTPLGIAQTVTTTFTPLLGPTTLTPVNSPTQ